MLHRLLCAFLLFPALALAQMPQPPQVVGRAWLVADASSGQILASEKADERFEPASLTKLMTAYLVFAALKEKKLALGQPATVSERAWRAPGSRMFIEPRKPVTVDELIRGMIVQSGNDACIIVAEGLAGNELAFSKQMEDEARRIGLKKSTFRNSTGLYHPEHLMTARELAILARYLIKEYPDRYRIFAQKEFQYRKHKFYNRNPLLSSSELGVDGLKTGHIKEAGYGMVVSAWNSGRRLIGVVMGLENEKVRKDEAQRLLEWGFRSFGEVKLFGADEEVGYARVWGGTQMYVPLTGKGELAIVLPRYPANQKLKAEIVYRGPLKPPIKKGDQVAILRVTSSANAESQALLYAAEDVETGSFVRKGLDSLMYLALRKVGL